MPLLPPLPVLLPLPVQGPVGRLERPRQVAWLRLPVSVSLLMQPSHHPRACRPSPVLVNPLLPGQPQALVWRLSLALGVPPMPQRHHPQA